MILSKHSALVLCLRNRDRDLVDQEVLLVYNKPKDKNDLKPGNMWGFPGGKCCNEKLRSENCCAETPEQTAVREFLEETGYIINVVQLYSDKLVHPESREKFVRYTYFGNLVGGKQLINYSGNDIISPRWFRLGAFPRNSYISHQKIIKRYFGHARG